MAVTDEPARAQDDSSIDDPRPSLDEMLRLAVPATAAIAQEYLPLIRAASLQAPQPEARARAQITGTKVAAGGMVAVLPLEGVITPRGSLLSRLFGYGTGGLEGFRDMLRTAMADPEVKAIVIDVNSPGGLVDMVPETAAEVRAARGQGKRIVAVANTMAASAAYWIASQADELVVTPSGQVGSIGVFTVHEDYSKMEERIGITTTLISAGRFKAEGAVGPLSRSALQALQANVDDLYSLFIADIAAGRGVSTQAVTAGYGEGRMVLAANAKPLGMVDAIETLEATIVRLGGMPADEDQDEAVIPDDGDDEPDDDAPEARAESGPSADRLYGEVGHNQPAWLLTD